MLVPMAKVNIVGHRQSLDQTLKSLHRAKNVQVINVTDDSAVHLPPLAIDDEHHRALENLRYLRARLDALLRLLPGVEGDEAVVDADVDFDALRVEIETAGPEIERLLGRLDQLRAEREALPRHLDSLRRLLPLLPEMGEMEGYETTALLVDSRHVEVLGELNEHLTTELQGNFEMMSDRLDRRTVGAVIIYPKHAAETVQKLLGREPVNRIRLPGDYEALPFRQALVQMELQLAELPGLIENAEEAVTDFVGAHPHWVAGRQAVNARIEQLSAIRAVGATPHTFVLSGWVPAEALETLGQILHDEVGDQVLVHEVEATPNEEPPVLLRNPAPARPFESLVKLLDTPKHGTLDPAMLMSIFLPLFFGMMLGDVVYGLVLLVSALLIKNRFTRGGFAYDLSRVLVFSGAWSIVWGVVYGEYLGDLGHRLFDIEPLWIDRATAIEPLLLFALAVGATHIVLGLVLGVWQAVQMRDNRKLGERIGMLIALIGLFAITGAAAGALPDAFMTPSIAAVIVGVVLLIAAGGVMGLLMGPLELIGTVGNVLSYLRIAAIGLASVYLAQVANELGLTGPLWIGIIVAALFHALNLVLGVFSPTIQALRLHYVEFFGKFYEGGGKAFHPFGSGEAKTSTHQLQR